jgi:hypothetical protein
MQKRGQASPDDGDALALTFAQAVAPAEKEERDEDDECGGHGGVKGPGRVGAMSSTQSGGLSQDSLPRTWSAAGGSIRYDTCTVRSSSQVGSKIRPQRYQLLPIRHIAAFLLATRSSFGAVISGME